MTKQAGKPGLMRSLGVFVGEIVKAVKTDPERYQQSTSRDVSEDERVVLRRTTTTVDEVVLHKESSDREPN